MVISIKSKVVSIVVLICMCVLGVSAHSAIFPLVIDLNDPINFDKNSISGDAVESRFGTSMASGDINGDGFDDIIVGAYTASGGTGKVYVQFGTPSLIDDGDTDLSASPSGVLTITGRAILDRAGFSVAVGNINGDAFQDIIIGAYQADPLENLLKRNKAGEVYVVFGSAVISSQSAINLSTSPAGVVRILGAASEDGAGYSVAAGDMNNDGFQDIIIGAYKADPLGRTDAGETYLVFGSAAFQTSGTIDLAVTQSGVARFFGIEAADMSGYSVGSGDFNTDGFDDIAIGAYEALGGKGSVYTIFGHADIDTLVTYDISDTNYDQVKIYGESTFQNIGSAVGSGDINGDGIDDLVLGGDGYSNNSNAVVMFGKLFFEGLGNVRLNLIGEDEVGILFVYGVNTDEKAGYSLSTGDINNDDIDELIIGAPSASPLDRTDAGTTYIVWGSADRSTTHSVDFDIDTTGISMIYGAASGDGLGSASAVGDFDGNGIGDLLAGANFADPDGRSNAGVTYVMPGFEKTSILSYSPDMLEYADPNSEIVINFNSDIRSVTAEVYDSVIGFIDVSKSIQDTQVTLTPDQDFTPGAWVRITLNGLDNEGTPFIGTSWIFNIKEDLLPPGLVSRSPVDQETLVGPGTNIIATFSGNIDPDSTVVNVLGNIQGAITMATSWTDSTLTIINNNSFQINELITVEISVADSYGDRNDYSWSFSTRPEITPPTFAVNIDESPLFIPAESTLQLTFSADIDTLSVVTRVEGSLRGDIFGTWEWSETTYTFFPDEPFFPDETMVLTMSASDIYRNSFADTTLVFQVKRDDVPPSIISRSPDAGELVVHPTSTIVMEYTSDVLTDSTTVAVTGIKQGVVSVTTAWTGDSLTLSHATAFQLSDTLTVAVRTVDAYNNIGEQSWSFEVRSELITPNVTVEVPGNPSLIGFFDPITLIFSADIDTASVDIELTGNSGYIIPGSWAWSDSLEIFTPSAAYPAGNLLTLTVNAADRNNNALTESVSTFTVKMDDIPPSVKSHIPLDNTLNVPLNSNIVINFTHDVVPDSTTVTVMSDGRGALAMTKTWSDSTLTLTHATPFVADETITVTLDAGDLYSNRSQYGWVFSTGEMLVTYFTVSVSSGDRSYMAINDRITIDFVRSINLSTVSTVLTGSVSGVIEGAWAWADTSYTFTPSVNYEPGKTLTLIINADDQYGNAIPESIETFGVGEHNPSLEITAVTLANPATHTYVISYEFEDPDESYTVTRGWEYTLDGDTWTTITASQISGNENKPPGEHSIIWVQPTLTGQYSDISQFRMEVYDGRFSSSKALSQEFLTDWNQQATIVFTSTAVDYTEEEITVNYRVSDVEQNTVSILLEYSTDYGETWTFGTPLDGATDILPGNYTGSLHWNYLEGLAIGIDYMGFRLRLTAFDFKLGVPTVYENVTVDLNAPPSVTLDDIFTTQTGDMSLQYHIMDAESDTISFVCSYSVDNGVTWHETTNVTGTEGLLAYDGSMVWQSKKDEPHVESIFTKFRVVPWDHDPGAADSTEVFQLFNNAPPSVTITVPEIAGGKAEIPFIITDFENNPVSLHALWSLDGESWSPATITSDTLNIAFASYSDTLVWNTRSDIGEGYFDDVMFRVSATDRSNVLGASQIITADATITLDHEPPYFEYVWGYANSDTIYFSFSETVVDSLVLNDAQFSVSGGLTFGTVMKGQSDNLFMLALGEGQKLPMSDEEMTITAMNVLDVFQNIAAETTHTFFTIDDNDNPTVAITDLPEEVTADTSVSFLISDSEGDSVSVEIFFSADGGNTWEAASAAVDSIIDASGYSATVIWDTLTDLPGTITEDVQLKIIATDSQEGLPGFSNLFIVDNNAPPSVTVSVAYPDSLYSGIVEIQYELSDDESDLLSILPWYSLDDGITYLPATPVIVAENISPDNYSGVLKWNTLADLPDSLRDVLVKLVPFDADEGTPDSLIVHIDNYGAICVKVTVPDGEQTADITVSYVITDENNISASLTVEYSVDEGETWTAADTDSDLTWILSEAYEGSFVWLTSAAFDEYEGQVLLRVTPDNGFAGVPDIVEVMIDFNEPPVISVVPLSAGELSGDISLSFTLTDAESDTVSMALEYSVDNRQNWYAMEASGDTSSLVADGSVYTAVWNSVADLPGWDVTNVWVRLSASDFDPGNIEEFGGIIIDNNNVPTVELSVADPNVTHGDYVEVLFTLSDTENNMLSIELLYSVDDGVTYAVPTVTGKTSGIFSSGYTSMIRWEISEDIDKQAGEAIVKLIPSDSDTGVPDSLKIAYNTAGISSVSLTIPQSQQTQDVEVAFQITNAKAQPVRLIPEYSTDSGISWHPAQTVGLTTAITADNYAGSFTWISSVDLDGLSGSAILRVTPNNGADGTPDSGTVNVDYNDPPSINSFVLSTDETYSGIIDVIFSTLDTEGDNLSVLLEYSVDSGSTYEAANVPDTSVIQSNKNATIQWSTFEDLGNCYGLDVHLRLSVSDEESGQPTVNGPFNITNLVGDYNFDGVIDGNDLPTFITTWNNLDISKEIGPVTGVPPQLTVVHDDDVDFEDLSVFIWMWNWYSEQVVQKAYVSKPSVPTVQGSDASQYVTVMPGANGEYVIESSGSPDFVQLIVEPSDGENMRVEISGDDYWMRDSRGLVLTRPYNGSVYEIAAARFGETVGQTVGTVSLGTLEIFDYAGDVHLSYKVRFAGSEEIFKGSAVFTQEKRAVNPDEFALSQNSPNPFNPKTTIEYYLPAEGRVNLFVRNISGQLVSTLVSENSAAGYHSVVWDASDMPSGIYFYTIITDGYAETRKMLLLK